MTMQEYAVAADWNNEVDLDTLEDIRVSGKPLRSSVVGLGEFDPGKERTFLGGLTRDIGTASWVWVSDEVMSPAELAHLMTTYLGGERSGNVTVRTRKNTGEYANFNAVLTFPKKFTMEDDLYYRVEWSFTQGVELP